MKIFKNPLPATWETILKRPQLQAFQLKEKVQAILSAVRTQQDEALIHYTEIYDQVSLKSIELPISAIAILAEKLSEDLKKAMQIAAANIEKFHSTQIGHTEKIETMEGVTCWRKSLPINKVGLYIPGGSAPLFSTLLMLGIPARIAGCKTVMLCTPPDKNGAIHPAMAYAAQLVGIEKIYTVGGVQAIGAMAYGTPTIEKVDKIFGPGNQYVTYAKQRVQEEGVAIDMPAGPSEVCVVSDQTGNPDFIAADMLAQAEHGTDSHAVFITTDELLLHKTLIALHQQLENLPRRIIAEKALENSVAVLVSDIEIAMQIANSYASEHLILACANAEQCSSLVTNAGSVFLGNYAPESVGDYASGTNHTLPTNGYARAYSGVSMDSFVKKITFQTLTPQGLLNIAETVELLAAAEGLTAHKNAVSLRKNFILNQ